MKKKVSGLDKVASVLDAAETAVDLAERGARAAKKVKGLLDWVFPAEPGKDGEK